MATLFTAVVGKRQNVLVYALLVKVGIIIFRDKRCGHGVGGDIQIFVSHDLGIAGDNECFGDNRAVLRLDCVNRALVAVGAQYDVRDCVICNPHCLDIFGDESQTILLVKSYPADSRAIRYVVTVFMCVEEVDDFFAEEEPYRIKQFAVFVRKGIFRNFGCVRKFVLSGIDADFVQNHAYQRACAHKGVILYSFHSVTDLHGCYLVCKRRKRMLVDDSYV